MEYRIHVDGSVALRVHGNPALRLLDDQPAALAQPLFGEEQLANRAFRRRLYDEGQGLARHDTGWVVRPTGIMLHANNHDDVNFAPEIFDELAYNIMSDNPTCVIDIGMNVGITSLYLAIRSEVREVHSFEPFKATYDRALANFDLNPTVASKIEAYNIGLANHDDEVTLRISPNGGDSGGMTIYEHSEGEPMRLTIRDAAAVLTPVITAARQRGLAVIVKVDCEGAEFAIFEAFTRVGIFADITALMVEWHRMFAGKTADTLIRPLKQAGFLVIDQSPAHGNGFFYAVRAAVADA